VLRRIFRPALQVPLAIACVFACVAELVLHRLGVAGLAPMAFAGGVLLTGAVSAIVVRLHVRCATTEATWSLAILWPPIVAALVGAAVDLIMHWQNHQLALSFEGWELGGRMHDPVSELGDVAVLSAFVGLAGTIALWSINALVVWAENDRVPARQADRREWVACAVWAVAFALSLAARAVATTGEVGATRATVWLSALAIACLGVRRVKTRVDELRRRRDAASTASVYR
jgi:hypothetical protein